MKLLKIAILFLLGALLLGCAHKPLEGHNTTYDNLLREIHNKGVFITKSNKAINFKISNNVLFNQNSINFNTKAYEILESLLNFSNYCEIDEIAIAGYGKNKFSMMARAHKIGEYLWHTKVNANFMYSYFDSDKYDCIIIKYSLI